MSAAVSASSAAEGCVVPESQGVFSTTAVKPELNQYWYSTNTIQHLLSEVRHHATACAFLSTPSLFFGLDTIDDDGDDDERQRRLELRRNSRIFEYDRQWSNDPCYVFYNYTTPEQVPIQYMAAFDYIVADPPFITADVWQCYVATARLLLKPDGKLLFTTVLENQTMLEGLVDRPLFIPRFFPAVRQLTYQYVCFLSYEATKLLEPNAELEAADGATVAAIQMANDLRTSEAAFAELMASRDRDGEARLPTAAYEMDILQEKHPELRRQAEAERAVRDWATVPIEQMEWGFIPEGWTMYPEGGMPPTETAAIATATSSAADGATTSNEAEEAVHGVEYTACLALRAAVESFKNSIDAMQRHMDAQMKLRHQRVKLKKQLAGGPEEAGLRQELEKELEETTQAIEQSEEERAGRLDEMAKLGETIVSRERQLAKLLHAGPITTEAAVAAAAADSVVDTGDKVAAESLFIPYATVMTECIEAYRRVEAKKLPLQELAADATRKYKFPLFNRMKELLQDMKNIKKSSREGAAGQQSSA